MVEILFEARGLIRTMRGVISMAEMDESAQRIQSHPDLDEMRYNIHDFTDVTDALLDEEDIHFMAIRASISVQRNPKLKIAFVGRHPIVFRMIEAFNTSGYAIHAIRRFDTLDEARAYSLDGMSVQRGPSP